MKESSYIYHIDPGHGWLAVYREDLQALGIADKITPFSYVARRGTTVYLEEDCDMTCFMEAFKNKYGNYPHIIEKCTNKSSFIRSLDNYSA